MQVHRTLRKHTTICSSVLFRPRRPSSILSSGLDSVIVVWEDFTRCRVGQVVKMADVVKVAAANKKEAEGDADPEPPSSYMVSRGIKFARKKRLINRTNLSNCRTQI